MRRIDLAKLDALTQRMYKASGADQRRPLREAGEYMHLEIKGRFDREAGGAGRWKKLEKATVEDRRKLKFGPEHPILQRSQGLLKAATGGNPPNNNQYWSGFSYKGSSIRALWNFDSVGGLVGGSRSRRSITQHSLTIGIESEEGYADTLNRARPFFYTTQKNEQYVRGIFQRYTRDWIRRARA